MLCETGDDRLSELRQIRDLVAAQVAGIIIVPTPKPHPESARLLQAVAHVQLLRNIPSLGAHWFGINDQAVLQTATEHLLQLGHRRLGYIGGTIDLPTGAARLAGFRAAIAAVGLPEHAGVVELGPPSSAEHGATALKALLAGENPPTAIVTGSVQVTRGVLDAAHAGRIAVPRNLSLVGFGDEPGFSWWGPGLTTISLPIHELATACGLWLLHQLETSPSPDAPFSSVSAGSLVLRGSTATPGPVAAGTGKRGMSRRKPAESSPAPPQTPRST
jgi:LacI family transcriptional regulator